MQEKWPGCIVNNLEPADTDDITYRQTPLIPYNENIADIDNHFGYGRCPLVYHTSGAMSTVCFPPEKPIHTLASERDYTPPPQHLLQSVTRPHLDPVIRWLHWLQHKVISAPTNHTSFPQRISKRFFDYIGSFNLAATAILNGDNLAPSEASACCGWRTISSNWQGEWFNSDTALPKAYNDTKRLSFF